VALASVIVTGVVGVVAPVVTYFTAKSSHKHEQRLAHQTRVFEQRSSAYEDALDLIFRFALSTRAENYEPLNDVIATLESSDEWRKVAARVGVHGTATATEAFRDFFALVRDFQRLAVETPTDSEALGRAEDKVDAAADAFAEITRKELAKP
jgi:hypothetical protein